VDLNPIDDLTGAVTSVLGGAAKAAGDAVLDSVIKLLFHLVASAVTAITTALIAAIADTTTVDLQGGWFASDRQQRLVAMVVAMAVSLLLVFVLLTIVRSLIAGEPAQMVRALLVDVPLAIFASVTVATVTGALLAITDAASAAVLGDVSVSIGQFATLLGSADALSGTGLLGLVFGVLFIAAAIVVWLQLLLRAALLYLVVTFAPLGFVARVYPGGRQIARRTIEIGVSLIVSKFAIALAFATGGAALVGGAPATAPTATPDLRAMLVGAAIMLLAAFMPWLVWRIIPVFESATVMQGVERAPLRTATTVASAAVTAASAARLAGGGGGAGTADFDAGGTDGSPIPFGGGTVPFDVTRLASQTPAEAPDTSVPRSDAGES
jgi:hypothetical protein